MHASISSYLTALSDKGRSPPIGGVTQAVATTLFAMFFLVALGKAYWHVLH
jgi:hypothetical protein